MHHLCDVNASRREFREPIVGVWSCVWWNPVVCVFLVSPSLDSYQNISALCLWFCKKAAVYLPLRASAILEDALTAVNASRVAPVGSADLTSQQVPWLTIQAVKQSAAWSALIGLYWQAAQHARVRYDWWLSGNYKPHIRSVMRHKSGVFHKPHQQNQVEQHNGQISTCLGPVETLAT